LDLPQFSIMGEVGMNSEGIDQGGLSRQRGASPAGISQPGAVQLQSLSGAWDALGIAVPAISALAQLSVESLLRGVGFGADFQSGRVEEHLAKLSREALALLYAAQEHGVIEVKVTPRAFRAAERFLAIHITIGEDQVLVFQDPQELRVAVEFLEGFAELCRAGLCLHQLHGEFSLTKAGFDAATKVRHEDVESWLKKAQEVNPM